MFKGRDMSNHLNFIFILHLAKSRTKYGKMVLIRLQKSTANRLLKVGERAFQNTEEYIFDFTKI
jgi:hypothetical protein